MNMHAEDWLAAFLLTQAIEVPVYLIAAGPCPLVHRAVYAFGASCITHPIIWFCLPWETTSYVPLLIIAESFAIGIEGTWGAIWRIPRPWLASLFANLLSLGLGSAIRWWFF
jgi:hypothetical protein